MFDNNFEVSVKPVRTTDDTQLRIKHLNSDFSQKYKDALGVSDTPVVMSGGIFSNLDTYESFGEELIEEGQDIYLIEMNGGPFTDCVGFENDVCPDYTFEDIALKHFPASIAGVLAYSEKDKVHYIGHSNGGRSALVGLNEYSMIGKNNAGQIFDYQTGTWQYVDLPNHPVSKFFGVAVPSVLNEDSVFTYLARNHGQAGLDAIKDKKHILLSDYASPTLNDYLAISTNEIFAYWGMVMFADNAPLSQNVMKFYNDLAADENSEIDLSNLEVDKLYLMNGYPTDLIVPISDADDIYYSASKINEVDKGIKPYDDWNHLENHVHITDNSVIKIDIKEALVNE